MSNEFNWEDVHIEYVNLKYRTDRELHITTQLKRVGLTAERFEGIRTSEHEWDANKWGIMLRRSPGACGCYQSQMEVLKKGLSLNKTTFVLEDDTQFCQDFKERMNYFNNFLDGKIWDIIWLGATWHVSPPHWHNGRNHQIPDRGLYRDAEQTEDQRIFRTYGCFCTYSYIINVNSIPKVLKMLEERIPTSIGIDFSMIEMQPDLITYSMVPGLCRQIDNKSDIGVGDTIFSGFAKLNGTIENSRYWYQELMSDFDPTTFQWNEASKR